MTHILSECVTKLGKSTASQIAINKISDNSSKKKYIDKHFVRVHNQIRQVNRKSDISSVATAQLKLAEPAEPSRFEPS